MTPISSQRYLSYFLHLVVAYFFIALVIVPKAYGAGVVLAAVGLLLFIFFAFRAREKCSLDPSCYAFVVAFCFYFFIYLLDVLIHQDSTKILDGPSRALAFLFVFYLFKNYPIKLQLLLYAIPLGGIATGIYASYQKFFLYYDRALSDTTYVIQSGDMAMSLGVFSFALFFYCWQKKEVRLSLLCILGALGGIWGSFLSGSRGGWLLMPFIFICLFFINRKIFTQKVLILFFCLFISAFAVFFIAPNSPVISKIEKAKTEIVNFGEKSNAGTSVGARLELWKASLLSVQQKPIFGWGEEGIKKERKHQHQQGVLAEIPANLGHAHNQFLNDTLERGVIGLLSLLAVFLFPLWQFFKAYRENKDNLEVRLLATLGMIHITSVMSYGLTQVFFAHNSGNMFYFFLTVLFYAMLLEYKKQTIHLNK